MIETPKLDELLARTETFGDRKTFSLFMTEEFKNSLIIEALLEIREILKTVRQRST